MNLGYSYFLRGWIKGATAGTMLDENGKPVSDISQIQDVAAFGGEQNSIGTMAFQELNPDLYFLMCQGVLHEDIPPDPTSAYTVPHPDYYDRFLMACGVGYPNWVVTDGIADPNRLASGFWDGPEDRKKGWVYFIPEDTSLTAIVVEMYAWYRQYGAIPEDEIIDAASGALWGTYKNPADVKRERHVFYYAWEPQTHNFFIRGIEAGNLCCEVMGWSESTQSWIFPRDWGQDIKLWMKRGPSDWKYFFNLIDWMNTNASTIGTTAVQVIGAVVTASTGGAAGPIMNVLVKGLTTLMAQAQRGDGTGAMLLTMFQTSWQMGQVADQGGYFANAKGEISKTIGKEAGKIVTWCEDVGKPFIQTYQKMQDFMQQGSGYYGSLSAAAKLGGVNLPKVDSDFLEKALTNSVLGEASYWAKKAASFSDPKTIQAYIDGIPEYAKEAAAFGGMLKVVQFQQYGQSMGSLHFYQGQTKVNQPGAFGVLQLQKPLAAIMGFPPAKYGSVVAKTNHGIVSAGDATEILPKPVQYGAAAAFVLAAGYFFRDYLSAKVLDKVFK